jgi:hypothetical protein
MVSLLYGFSAMSDGTYHKKTHPYQGCKIESLLIDLEAISDGKFHEKIQLCSTDKFILQMRSLIRKRWYIIMWPQVTTMSQMDIPVKYIG